MKTRDLKAILIQEPEQPLVSKTSLLMAKNVFQRANRQGCPSIRDNCNSGVVAKRFGQGETMRGSSFDFPTILLQKFNELFSRDGREFGVHAFSSSRDHLSIMLWGDRLNVCVNKYAFVNWDRDCTMSGGSSSMELNVVLFEEPLSLTDILKRVQMEQRSFFEPIFSLCERTSESRCPKFVTMSDPSLVLFAKFKSQNYISENKHIYLLVTITTLNGYHMYVPSLRAKPGEVQRTIVPSYIATIVQKYHFVNQSKSRNLCIFKIGRISQLKA